MKISREWLQTYFEKELPAATELAGALTFHAFEIESVENDVLDVKVTPNRGHDALSHRAIAKELSAILRMPMKVDPLRQEVRLEPKTDMVRVVIEDAALCPRFTGALIRGVRVGPSPEWLCRRLKAIGQKSINNVVDATNYVMFDLGQPLHAFDAGKVRCKDDHWKLAVRNAKEGETLVGLDEKEYELTPTTIVIEDAHAQAIVSIAGIKGGRPTGVETSTNDIIVEAANWHGPAIRKASTALALRTDASDRFQYGLSPELAAYGLNAAADLIVKIAGGSVQGYVDEYPRSTRRVLRQVSVSIEKIRAVLGADLSITAVADAFARLHLAHREEGGVFTVNVPFERLDLEIPEDLIEEVGRIVGYDAVPSVPLPVFPRKPEVHPNYYAAEKRREELANAGYSEVYTSVFAEKGERVVANKVDGARPFLRATLVDGLKDAYEKNLRNKELLGLTHVRLFEIGTVWSKEGERVLLGTADENGVREEPLEGIASDAYEEYAPTDATRYQPFSKYPFVVRDVAFWVPKDTSEAEARELIRAHAGSLLRRCELFDRFEKGERISFAFRLVFQSFDRTLTDGDANERMESIHAALKARGFEVR